MSPVWIRADELEPGTLVAVYGGVWRVTFAYGDGLGRIFVALMPLHGPGGISSHLRPDELIEVRS